MYIPLENNSQSYYCLIIVAEIITTVPGEANSSIWLTDLFCFGTENNLFECPRQYDVGSFRHCGHDKDVALRCFSE